GERRQAVAPTAPLALRRRTEQDLLEAPCEPLLHRAATRGKTCRGRPVQTTTHTQPPPAGSTASTANCPSRTGSITTATRTLARPRGITSPGRQTPRLNTTGPSTSPSVASTRANVNIRWKATQPSQAPILAVGDERQAGRPTPHVGATPKTSRVCAV